MEKIIAAMCISIAAIFCATGCTELRCVDWSPVEVVIFVPDSDGNDLLDPSSDAFIGDKIKISWKGEDYAWHEETKAYEATFYGLRISLNEYYGRYNVVFGELPGEKDYDDDFIISFPDGSASTIHYDRKVNERTISARKKWYLDGERVDLPIVITY